MSEQTATVRTDELHAGDRVWHPFDLVCFTVAHKPEPIALDFEGERGLRVTGATDRGEAVHVDVSPAYKWHRGPAAEAPTAPLAVNTADGTCWTRRGALRNGQALYAPEGVCSCPEFVMATLAELAEHGITGSVDALPMPTGAEVAGPSEAELDVALGEVTAYLRLRLALASAQRGRRELRARVVELEVQRDRRRGRLVALQNDALSMRGSLAPADGERKVPFELGETLTPAVDWLIARVAELEAAQGTIYRASHDSIVMGLYTTAAAARAHCEAEERRAWAKCNFDWVEDEEDGVAELVVMTADGEEPTGYVVTALDVASEYDEEADE